MLLPNLGPLELVIILVIVLLFVGSKRLPGLARSIGSGITEFRKGMSGQTDKNEDSNDRDNSSSENKGQKS